MKIKNYKKLILLVVTLFFALVIQGCRAEAKATFLSSLREACKNGESFPTVMRGALVKAEAGDADAKAFIALAATLGLQIDRVIPEDQISKLAKESANSGSALGKIMVARLNKFAGNHDVALKLFKGAVPLIKQLAMEGDPIAQDILGDCYADGDGITQDPREAMSWYRKSAAQGLPFAQFDLGERLSHGQGEEQAQEVFTWYKKAADKEYPVAQLHLAALYVDGKGTTKDPDKALQMLRKSAEHGYAESQCELANLYSFEQRDDLFHARTVPSFLRANRDPSISKESRIDFDLKQAVEWYRKAASRGNLEAKFELFKLFRQGEGVARDLKEALKLVTEAANGGNSRAQMSLGRLYEQGEMVEQNKGEALKWYSKALDSDDGKFLEEFKRKVERRIDDIDPQEGNRRSQRKLEKQLSEIEAKSKEVAAKSLDEHSGKFGGPSTEQVMISIGGASFGDNKVTVRRGEVLISTGGKAPVGTKLFPVRVSSEVNGLNVSLTFRFWKDAFGDWKFEKVNN